MPPSKNGSLGRGLGELIDGIPATIGSAAAMSSTGFIRLSPDLIGFAPEREARVQAVSPELVESVRVHGILQPLLVRRRAQGYEVVVGARRLVAARLAGLKEIPAVIIHATDEEALELSTVENTCRETVSPVIPVSDSEAPAENVREARCWTPARVLRVCGMASLLLALGAGVGLWFGQVGHDESQVAQVQVPPAPAPEPIVKPVPVVEAPRTVQKLPELDVSDFKVLESEGLTLAMESNGMARVTFDAPLFSSRTALAAQGSVLLSKIGAVLSRHSVEWEVVVTGHTDAVPLRGSGLYRDNKELGLARALEVVRYLMREANVPAAMLQAATAGEENPPFPGEDVDSCRKNRTVTLQIRLCQ